jgi:hypothetical protein
MFGFVAKVYKALSKRVTLDEAVEAVDNKGTVYAESSRYRLTLVGGETNVITWKLSTSSWFNR